MAKAQKITLKAQQQKGKGKTEKDVELLIQGELTIHNSVKFKDFLLDNLKKFDHFVLKVNNVDNIDLGAVQLIQRFYWDAQEEKKTVEFIIDLPEEHRVLLERSGLSNFLTLTN